MGGEVEKADSMGEEQSRREGLGKEVCRHLRGGDVDEDGNAIRHEATDVVVADVDVAGFPGNLGGFRELDSRAVVFKDCSGANLGKTIRIKEVAEVRYSPATAGEAYILSLHA